LFFWGVSHGELVYRCQFGVNSLDVLESGSRLPNVISGAECLQEESELQNGWADLIASGTRQIIGVLMILFGSLLALNASTGPCGGTVLATEPFPAIFVAILGLELVVCSYFPVKKLKAESDFRVIIYLFLVLWSLSVLFAVVDFVSPGEPRTREDLSEVYFSLLRGLAAVANLIFFYRWAGTKNMITRIC
jgi:hypothetical protein